ncbi:Malonyl CoA-acyl carrier protein transacylase [Streptacidiphilus jiangxiensis]|uniref:Malonyl CoA-acyl carrier protein transacylase n=2 Tax=Streptacidiphilus jiangxiensis TaxID=235985 RepID=A0A1H7JLU4_STRJI|nr:Malonyl CoA-acyl carrier protein transacylase [Streptacidiphilus jiangxiensis]
MTVLLLPGQGAQRERMAAALLGRDGAFTEAVEEFLAALPTGAELREAWLRPAPNPALDDALLTQPLLFAVGYGLGRVVSGWGGAERPLLLGHSVGELAAATLAGVMDAAEVAALMADRAEVLADAPAGGMLGVSASPDELRPYCDGTVVVGAVNGPRQTVLAGPERELAEAGERIAADGFTVRPLRSGYGFHSPSMASAAQRQAHALAGARLRPPTGSLVSSRTARPVTAAEAVRPDFWADQLQCPVLYWPALRALLDTYGEQPGLVLLDASPDRSLSAPARRHPAVRGGQSVVVPLLAQPEGEDFGAARAAHGAAVAPRAYAAAAASAPSTWAISAAGVFSPSSSSSEMVTG